MSLDNLKAELAQGKVRGAYLLCGDDDAHRDAALKILEASLIDQEIGSWSKERIDPTVATGADVIDLLATPPLIGARRVVMVQPADELREMDALLPQVEHPPGFSTLILVTSKSSRQIAIASKIKKAGGLYEFSVPQGGRLAQRLKQMARDSGVTLDEAAVKILIERVGDDLTRAQNEIDKLALYAEEGHVKGKDASAVVSVGLPETDRFAFFNYVDAVAVGNTAQALTHLEELLHAGESPLAILGMLARQFRLLYGGIAWQGASPQALAEAMGIKNYPAQKAITQARRWSPNRVTRALEACVSCDQAIKRGVDGRMALELLTVQLILDQKQVAL